MLDLSEASSKHCLNCTSYIFVCSFIFIHFKISIKFPVVSSLTPVSLEVFNFQIWDSQTPVSDSYFNSIMVRQHTLFTVIHLNLWDLILFTYYIVLEKFHVHLKKRIFYYCFVEGSLYID